mgnify:CR=1 FL=1
MNKKTMMRPAGYQTPWEKIRPYIYIFPAMFFLAVFVIYPLLDVIVRSFQKWNMITDPVWVGWDNYAYNFQRKEFIDAIVHTITYAIFVVGVGLTLSTIFAVWLSKNTFLNNLTRNVMFMPHVIALLSVAMVWAWIMNKDNGLLNMVLNFFGLESLKWIDSSETAMMSVIIVALWKAIGYNTMLIYAAIQNVPAELYEAADLDNATSLKKFFKITLPMISPTIFFNVVMAVISSFQYFTQAFVMTEGGPLNSTLFYNLYLYTKAYKELKMGYAAALAWIMFIIILFFTLLVIKSSSFWVYYQNDDQI